MSTSPNYRRENGPNPVRVRRVPEDNQHTLYSLKVVKVKRAEVRRYVMTAIRDLEAVTC